MVLLDGAGLTCAQVHAAAYGGARVTIASLDRARAAWVTAREPTGPVYGRGADPTAAPGQTGGRRGQETWATEPRSRRVGAWMMRRRRVAPSAAAEMSRTAARTIPSMSQSTVVSPGVSNPDIG